MRSLGLVVGVVAAAVASALAPSPAHALLSLGPPTCPDSVCEGITYTLESQNTADPLTKQFALVITGENSVSDTIGGRTGINAIAFNLVQNNPPSPNSGVMVGTIFNGVLTKPDPSFQFHNGGLNSSGCNGQGNFFCFDNVAIPPIPASPLLTGTIVLGFEVTLIPGTSWAGFAPDLKIDWVGPAQHNYSLVSAAIPVNDVCPNCIINPTGTDVPEPPTAAAMLVALLGFGLMARRRRG